MTLTEVLGALTQLGASEDDITEVMEADITIDIRKWTRVDDLVIDKIRNDTGKVIHVNVRNIPENGEV